MIPDGVPPAPRIDEYVLAPPATRTPVPTTFNQFLTRRPESGETAARRASGDSSDTALRVRTAPPATPAARAPSLAPPARAASAFFTSRPAAPAPPGATSAGSGPAAKAGPPPADASSISEALPKVPPEAVPVLTRPMEELMSFPFTPAEAFIVSRINGMWDVRSIARISPFPEHEVMRVFQKLSKSGVVSFK
jgi:hypothetical protein